MGGTLTRRNAVLVLLKLHELRTGRAARVSQLYLLSRRLLVDSAVAPELADALRGADPSTIYLVLDELRSDGMVSSEANRFRVTQKGGDAVQEFLDAHPEAVASSVTELAATA